MVPFLRFCKGWVSSPAALLAGLLFAVHPVHTEAVAGVVGRADVLSCILFLACLLVHQAGGWAPANQSGGWTWRTPALAAMSMLAKEQGITVLGVCAAVDVLRGTRVTSVRKSLLKLFLSSVILLSLRTMALEGQLPSFSKSDNPASHSGSLKTRALTFLLLPALNLKLLVAPATLRE